MLVWVRVGGRIERFESVFFFFFFFFFVSVCGFGGERDLLVVHSFLVVMGRA